MPPAAAPSPTPEQVPEPVFASAPGLCLDDPSGGVDYGIQLDVAACRDTAGQRWRMP